MTRLCSPTADDVPTFGRPGYVFRESAGSAQLLEFEDRRVRVLSLEHGQLQLRCYRRNGQQCRPDHRIELDELCERGAHPDRTEDGQGLLFPLDPDAPAIHRFIKLIPKEIWERVLTYPRWMQFRLLSLFVNQGDRATRLHDSGCYGFVAVVAVADWLRRQPTPAELIRRWLDRPQAEVLAELTLPGTKRVARIVRKIEVAACQYPLLRNLRSLHDPRLAREVSHLPRLNALVLDVLPQLRPEYRLVTTSCLRELSELNPTEVGAVDVVLNDHLSRHRHLEKLLGESLPRPTFANVKQLLAYRQWPSCGELPELRDAAKIPPPPFDQDWGFVSWIDTPGELLREGEEMYHCVFSYLPLLTMGRAAAARVYLGEERATAVIVRRADGSWHMEELRLRGNAKPSAALRERFANWLARQTVTHPPLPALGSKPAFGRWQPPINYDSPLR